MSSLHLSAARTEVLDSVATSSYVRTLDTPSATGLFASFAESTTAAVQSTTESAPPVPTSRSNDTQPNRTSLYLLGVLTGVFLVVVVMAALLIYKTRKLKKAIDDLEWDMVGDDGDHEDGTLKEGRHAVRKVRESGKNKPRVQQLWQKSTAYLRS